MATVTGGRLGAEAPAAVVVPGIRPATRQSTFWKRLRRDKAMLLLAAPGVLYLLVFVYIPQLGNVIAFQNYVPYLGFASPFVGFDNFRSLFGDSTFWSSVINTVVISGLQLILYFPAPILLALLLNSLISLPVRRVIQSIVYLPHFISWVIIVALFQQVLGGTGLLDHFMRAIGQQPVNLLASPPLFKWMMTAQVIWKETGWGTIIYLAALLSIDVTLYEAAAVDGAGPWRRLWHVTVPGIVDITILLFILRLGAILTVGFEQILLQQNAVGEAAGEVLDTFVYFHGIAAGQWAPAAAAGLIKGIVGLAIVLGANRVAHLFGHQGVLS
ncbi:MAG: sugar ABC transporter permease [Chloroflexi bacterium]|nr:sugar ABC transporter permease [Chloroflexota bacterium]MBV9595981.1 sugar ABC transporter permease [Chloroflexota bacterium]